jgi:signal transduction histidine kinase/DNA-binding response OmpR family regulator
MRSDDKVNILVVDDLPDKLTVVGAILQELGENVVAALSGREALRRLLDQDYAVILLDVNMPDIDGFETAQLIRQRPRSAHTPIIFITAYGDEVRASKGYQLGAVDYITSPIIPEVLRTKVGVFVELYRKTEQVKQQAEQRVALAREQAARAAAEEATRRSLFLAEATTTLANSLDFDATARGLLRLVVPYLADASAVTVAGDLGCSWRSELTWMPAPNHVVETRRLGLAEEPHDDLWKAVEKVLAGGAEQVLTGIDLAFPNAADAGNGSPAHRIRAALVLPLLARGRTLGALTLARSAPQRRFSAADLVLARDLAGRAAIALDNARLYGEIHESDRLKNEFLAMLAHELRNPLAPIRNAVLVMRAAPDDEKTQCWAQDVIDRQVRQMVRLVDDLLEVSRITRGKITLQTRMVDVAAVVADALETSRPLVDARRHELNVSLPPAPLQLRADPARLAQVIANLLNNAAKYTSECGKIGLTVRNEGDEVVFRVRDNGVGIPLEMQARVFDLFTQVEDTLDRSQGGLGIGLTVARRLVELHGGKIEAHSDGPGKGSEFVVRVPMRTDALPTVSGAPHRANGSNAVTLPDAADDDVRSADDGPAGFRTLVVDDNVDAAESLATLLRVRGHEVRTAHDGQSALTVAEDFRPEVVLLDIGLPRIDGYEVARRLRRRPELAGVHLVSLTGYGQVEDRRRSCEAGFDHHLVKPVSIEILHGLLGSLRSPTLAS